MAAPVTVIRTVTSISIHTRIRVLLTTIPILVSMASIHIATSRNSQEEPS
jgi:hypothetical protein